MEITGLEATELNGNIFKDNAYGLYENSNNLSSKATISTWRFQIYQ